MNTSFLDQAVTGKLSLQTLMTLLNIASEPTCQRVRYLMPEPQRFELFIPVPSDFKPTDMRSWESTFREPEELTLNQLCKATLVVVQKIEQFEAERTAAKRTADAQKKRADAAVEEARMLRAMLFPGRPWDADEYDDDQN